MFELSENYQKELEEGWKIVKQDSRLKPIQKEIIRTIITCEKFAGYDEGEFEESTMLYDNLGLLLDNELIKVGKETYSLISWWFYKKVYSRDMGYLANFILANWFSIMHDNDEKISYKETDTQIEEIYILHKTFIHHEDISEILNLSHKEGLNVIQSIWIEEADIKIAISCFLNKIAEKKYLKSASKDEMYYDNGQWLRKTITMKHKWKKRYKYYLELNEKEKNNLKI